MTNAFIKRVKFSTTTTFSLSSSSRVTRSHSRRLVIVGTCVSRLAGGIKSSGMEPIEKRRDLFQFIRRTMYWAAMYPLPLDRLLPRYIRGLGFFIEWTFELFLYLVSVHIAILYVCTIYLNYDSGDLELLVNCMIQTIIYIWTIVMKVYFRRIRTRRLQELVDTINSEYRTRSAIGNRKRRVGVGYLCQADIDVSSTPYHSVFFYCCHFYLQDSRTWLWTRAWPCQIDGLKRMCTVALSERSFGYSCPLPMVIEVCRWPVGIHWTIRYGGNVVLARRRNPLAYCPFLCLFHNYTYEAFCSINIPVSTSRSLLFTRPYIYFNPLVKFKWQLPFPPQVDSTWYWPF